MQSTRSTLRAPHPKPAGGTLMEYAFGITIVALSALAATQLLGCRVSQAFQNVTHSIAKAF